MTKINNIINNKYKKLDFNDYLIFIYNLLRKLLLNIEIDYYKDKHENKGKKYNNFNKKTFNIDFIIPLD